MNSCRIKKLATDNFACSKDAGKWAFGKRASTVVNNGIDTERFAFNEDTRNRIRKNLGLSNETVYGHVGRFVPVKNHAFLLDVFERILQKDPDSVLMLIGEGELSDDIKKLAEDKGINQKILFLGRQEKVADFMNAMDVFMLPSKFEGLSVVTIEAQASGLPCLVSDAVPCEVDITPLVHFLPVSYAENWAQQAVKMRFLHRQDMREEIQKAGYDIGLSAHFLEEYYCSRA